MLLPHGTLHGRLDGSRASTLLDAAALGLDALSVSAVGGDWLVRHRDGRSWRVTVSAEETAATRPESCGKVALPTRRSTTGILEAD